MTYSRAIEYLRSLQVFGLCPGLETTRELARRCGNPQERLRFIHVAGTNGKGSVCAMLEAMYRASGRRVGLYTSPHLVAFGERMQIDRRPIREPDVARWVDAVRGHVTDPLPGGRPPTFFEFVTVMALGYFAEQDCELVIWETGLGGRLDATNIVSSEASVITNIDLEHQQWLGATYDAIATEKAGIIKAGRPVITAACPGRGLEVIAATARRLGCPLTVVADGTWGRDRAQGKAGEDVPLGADETVVPRAGAWTWATSGFGPQAGEWPSLGLAGDHQKTNAAVALATVAALAGEWPVSVSAMRAGLEKAEWPGRLQWVRGPGGQQVLLDGAHNTACARVLRDAWAELGPRPPPALILGMLGDKDWVPMVEILAPMASRILTVPVGSQRTLAPAALAEACHRLNPRVEVVACGSLEEALSRAGAEPFVVITGSLYLVGEALERLGQGQAPASERRLNEWGTAGTP